MPEATLVAVLAKPPSPSGQEIVDLPPAVRWLQVRADRAGDLDPQWLRDRFSGELLYTLRSSTEGGAFESVNGNRPARLLAAARGYDLVELEADRDLTPDLLAALPADRRLLSWHGPQASLAELRQRWRRLASVAARLYQVTPQAREPGDAMAPLRLLKEVGSSNLAAFASGPAGLWSRLLAPRLGAPLAFAAASPGDPPTPETQATLGSRGTEEIIAEKARAATPGLAADAAKADAGELALRQLVGDYGLPDLPPIHALYGIVGPAAARSLSPRLHNAAYRALGIGALYLPFPAQDFAAFWRDVVERIGELGLPPLRGLTVTGPHKEAALAAAGQVSRLAGWAGAANTLLRRNGCWRADTADAEGVLAALDARRVAVAGRQVAVVGCGGAGRAAAAGLKRAGAKVTLVNRGLERGRFAGQLLGLPFVPLSDFSPRAYPLVVHATPLRHAAPFAVEDLHPDAVVVDLVYGSAPTPLMTAAAAGGGTAIDGREVLLIEARRQFQLMTGRRMPAGAARVWLGSG